ncbi:MAG: hypothetical protein HPY53_01160 [Brevinematales bacterium]|nr:hypothetical protein [Brevinematales bacterium]
MTKKGSVKCKIEERNRVFLDKAREDKTTTKSGKISGIKASTNTIERFGKNRGIILDDDSLMKSYETFRKVFSMKKCISK